GPLGRRLVRPEAGTAELPRAAAAFWEGPPRASSERRSLVRRRALPPELTCRRSRRPLRSTRGARGGAEARPRSSCGDYPKAEAARREGGRWRARGWRTGPRTSRWTNGGGEKTGRSAPRKTLRTRPQRIVQRPGRWRPLGVSDGRR